MYKRQEAVSSTEETVLSAAELAETGTELAVPLLQPTRREADRADVYKRQVVSYVAGRAPGV